MRPGGQARLWVPGSARDTMPALGCPRGDPFRSLLPALLKPQPRKKPRTSGASPMSGLWSAVNDSARQREGCASEARIGVLGTHHTL